MEFKSFLEKENNVEEQLGVVNRLIKEADSWGKGSYYLGGHLKFPLGHRITKNNIDEARLMDTAPYFPENHQAEFRRTINASDLNTIDALITKYSGKRR